MKCLQQKIQIKYKKTTFDYRKVKKYQEEERNQLKTTQISNFSSNVMSKMWIFLFRYHKTSTGMTGAMAISR